jgi:hypothetical protein
VGKEFFHEKRKSVLLSGAVVVSPAVSVVAECLALTQPAETAFSSRWRLSTLARVNAGLHQALCEQIDLYNAALVTGSATDAREHAAAMVRGWRAACGALESPLLPDDAYLTGFDTATGTRVVIAEQQAAIGRIQRVAGERVVIVTPDEVARMVAAAAIVAECKAFFPDAELVAVHGARS